MAGTCEQVAAAVILPLDWQILCTDHISSAVASTTGMASLNYKTITVERQTDPQLMRYIAAHEAGHAWAFLILDETAKATLVTQVGAADWRGDANYWTGASESFANAFASCRGYGSMEGYLPMNCDDMSAALTAAGTR